MPLFSPSMAIGAPVIGGTGSSGLFVDSSGNLAQDAANLVWDVSKTGLRVPLLIGGNAVASPLKLRATSAVGTTGADIIFQVGNNGATEAARILNSGKIGIGTINPQQLLEVNAGASEARVKIFGDNPVLSLVGDANAGVNDYYLAARGGSGVTAGWLAVGPLTATDAALPATSADILRINAAGQVATKSTLYVGQISGISTINEMLVAAGDASAYSLLLDNTTSDGGANRWRLGASGAAWGVGDNKLVLTYETTTSTAGLFTVDGPTGSIGMGMAAPGARLEVNGLVTHRLAPTTTQTVTAGYGASVPDSYEIVNGVQLDIGDGAIVEIS